MKFKTIEQVFTHNFEALRQWRGKMSVPSRWPDAVGYFVATQLIDPRVMLVDVPRPRLRNSARLVFYDASVLTLPDDLVEDSFEYQEETRENLAIIQTNIRLLASKRGARQLILGAIKILDSIDKIDTETHEEVRAVNFLLWELKQKLVDAFRHDRCRVTRPGDLPSIAGCAKKLLDLSPDLRAEIIGVERRIARR